MAKRIFAVVLEEGARDGLDRLREKYQQDFIELTPTTGLVRADADAATVAGEVGIPRTKAEIESKEGYPEGLVFEVIKGRAVGYTFQAVWAWLDQGRGASE
ncbi:MAG: hypothetical protein F4228_13915 [Acidobacteria bacterium]|nr:hypothetical protein [Acidobacteriota bacterium]MYF15790.1 hypothetical protein [Acidobacteriota bacterium]MYI95911.1 hypothetical protein [Acidobacteriota bacterium]